MLVQLDICFSLQANILLHWQFSSSENSLENCLETSYMPSQVTCLIISVRRLYGQN